MSTVFGYVSPQSTNQLINFIAADNDNELLTVVGKMLYFDTEIEGKIYRAVGTVTDIRTENPLFNTSINGVVARGHYSSQASRDLRMSRFNTQAVFVRDKDSNEWSQASAYLPTSPSTNSKVMLLDEAALEELTDGMTLPYVGTFRGTKTMNLPINTPDFGGNRGSYHSAVVGKSGSGKTAGYTFILSTYMRHEQHAIVVIDPQGQWSNENGFIFSPQEFARGLGREVSLIRIAEEVRLPKDPELIARIADNRKAWSRMRRMGTENKEVFSTEVAERLVREGIDLDGDVRVALEKVFLDIAKSNSAMRRIYADDKARDQFRAELYALAGEVPDDVDTESDDYEPPTQEDLADVESSWESILKVFKPLLSLFSSKNLHGGKRHPLSGDKGVLARIFQTRKEGSAPAPYVVIDMSPDVKTHAKRALNRNDDEAYMAAMLDNDAVKALILQVLFQEIKKASETAFAAGGGTLNTQIVFDEAWRYAPEGKSIPEIEELANMLEGFALDTRKFGIGWTYILQSPTDLKRGIWNQLTYVYAAYGLVGADVKMLEERYSDQTQTEIYRGFISPAATNVYPMMIVGSISPLIFTNSPTFLDMFTSAEQFMLANRKWVDAITTKRGLGRITSDSVNPYLRTPASMRAGRKTTDEVVVKTYKVGKSYASAKPQTQITPKETAPETDLDTPF